MDKHQYAPGIHFNLPEAEYHAIPALSASAIKELLISPALFWTSSWMNPNKKEDEDTAAKIAGSAYHTRILEGRDVFYQQYAVKFAPEEHKDALRTVDDLRGFLKDRDQKTGGNKPDLIDRILALYPDVPIIDVLQEKYEQLHEGKIFLSFDLVENIEISAAYIEKNPHLNKCFVGGYPEVTIIWEDMETGLLMKARVDYLKLRAIVDLKTYDNTVRKPIDRAIISAMANYKYHIQTAVYHQAVEQAVFHAREGRVFGDHDPDWIKKFAASADHRFVFVFQMKGSTPIARGKIMPKHLVYECGLTSMRNAIEAFLVNLQIFGTDRWVEMQPIEEFSDDEFPVYTTDI